MIVNFCSLNNLKHLCISTKQSYIIESNEYFPFEQIQLFIDQCCPRQTILKTVILKFDCINFSQTMWSTIVRYKTIFDHFHFYATFRLEDKLWKNTIISSLVNQFDFYIEDGDPLHAQIRFIHVYSLPFIFNKLHGFISCEELSTRSSFSSVRHLYIIQTRLARRISFASLINRMPRLMSIDCNLFFAHSHRMDIPEVLVNRDNFIYIRIFRYVSHCMYRECDCHDLLPQFLHLMPHLQDLTTSEENFIDGQHSFPTIKRLDLRQSRFELFDNLIRYIPHLSKIFLGVIPSNSRNLFYLLKSLFIQMSSLELVSFNNNVQCNVKVKSYKSAQQVLVLTKRMNNRLRYLKLDYTCGIVAFYLQNL
ncbi:unnamed protein product [Adineta ricciae]|uniref:F-box domain-containing protein n=1 Tax=Adineta ricciae TaxID=249248 RepID=A0A815VW52_ADIRI|nr:unnamed protein product [Adineta ricciae]